MTSVIRVRGVLRGLERDGECELLIWKESSSAGEAITRCKIASEPPDLPDGPYTLSAGGHALETRKFEGEWSLSVLPPKLAIEWAA